MRNGDRALRGYHLKTDRRPTLVCLQLGGGLCRWYRAGASSLKTVSCTNRKGATKVGRRKRCLNPSVYHPDLGSLAAQDASEFGHWSFVPAAGIMSTTTYEQHQDTRQQRRDQRELMRQQQLREERQALEQRREERARSEVAGFFDLSCGRR